MALTNFLTQIADSIRSKDGTTDKIPATEFPQRILAIPSGGGSESAFDVVTGEFILSDDHDLYVDGAENNFIINHNIGKIPFMFYLYADYENMINKNINTITFVNCTNTVMLSKNISNRYTEITRVNSSSNSVALNNAMAPRNARIEIDESTVTIGKYVNEAGKYIFRAGNLYKWIALVSKE